MAFSGMTYVVDDNPASAMSLKAVLTAYEFNVKTFESAEAFLDILDDIHPESCLVLDLRLPGMSGLELQQELAVREVELPIVMISGHADQQSVDQALENGAASFLQKPFSGSDLRDAIFKAASKQ